MPAIFISYRRTDAGGHARALHKYLSTSFGPEDIFFDQSTIESGDVFPDTLRQGVEGCAVLLALIGPHWLEARGEDGNRRLDDAEDFVRREVALALEHGKKVIPVLFDDTPVPPRDRLPEPLKALAGCDALTLRGKNYEYEAHLRKLVELLEKVPGVPPAQATRDQTEANDVVSKYAKAFVRTYAPVSRALIPFICHADGAPLAAVDVIHRVSGQDDSFVLRGPSGCGKTMLATVAGLEFTSRGGVAVIIPVKDYKGRLRKVLNREARLLDAPSGVKLLGAAQRLGRPVLLICDGYNECGKSEQTSLTRELAALSREYRARILVTPQIELAEGHLLSFREIEIPAPSHETKVAIARAATGTAELPSETEHLLAAVTSGLEARLAGEVGSEFGGRGSRYALFDAFTRKRLGDAASDGIRWLALVAGTLVDCVAFSLSVRDLDRIAEAGHVPQSLLELTQRSGLLIKRGDRMSFVHEMFFDAYAAESVVRAANDPGPILAALVDPRHAGRKEMIIGAIDDDLLLDRVLEQLTDSAVVIECLSGTCGRRAKEWAEVRCQRVLDQLRDEAGTVRFAITDKALGNVAFEAGSLTAWREPDRTVLAALPQLLARGHQLDAILDIVAVMDHRIAEEQRRLQDEARERKLPIRSGLFANTYVLQTNHAPGITHVCSQLRRGLFLMRNGLFRSSEDEICTAAVQNWIARHDLSPGQMYVLLALGGQCFGAEHVAAPLIMRALKCDWANAPYHLRLELMHVARMCWRTDEAERSALVDAIEALPHPTNPFISTTIIDALQALGALETPEREHEDVVREEIKECLNNPNDPSRCAAAYGIYVAQFDHPYSAAYSEVISGLTDEERTQIMIMAATGADDSSFFLSPLIIDLALSADSRVGPSIVRWTALPPTDSFMPQDAIGVFVVAHVALGRLAYALLDRSSAPDRPVAKALAACGEILYWRNRVDLRPTESHRACHRPLEILSRHNLGVALNVVRNCEHAFAGAVTRFSVEFPVETSIVNCFPMQAVEICPWSSPANDPEGIFPTLLRFRRAPGPGVRYRGSR